MQIFLTHTQKLLETKPSICVIECTYHNSLFCWLQKQKRLLSCLEISKRAFYDSKHKGTTWRIEGGGGSAAGIRLCINTKKNKGGRGQLLLYKQKVLIWVKRLLLLSRQRENLYLETSYVRWHATHEMSISNQKNFCYSAEFVVNKLLWMKIRQKGSTYLKLENHLTSCAVLFLLNLMSGKYILRMAEEGYLVQKNINLAFLKCIGVSVELWASDRE